MALASAMPGAVGGGLVARERHFAGKSYWTCPIVEFATRHGTQIRRLFGQIARPTIGRKLRIVYDPSTLTAAEHDRPEAARP